LIFNTRQKMINIPVEKLEIKEKIEYPKTYPNAKATSDGVKEGKSKMNGRDLDKNANDTFKKRVYIGFVIAVLLSFGTGVISYLGFKNQTDLSAGVKHTYLVENATQHVQMLIIDLETGQRGFRATNEKRFLEPYNAGKLQIGPAIAVLKSLVSDNPAEEQRVAVLEKNIWILVRFWNDNSDDAARYTKEVIRTITDDEKRQMDEIRNNINDILVAENITLAARNNENDRSIKFATTASFAGTAMTLAIISILIMLIIREFRKGSISLEQLSKNNSELAFQNDEKEKRAAELIIANKELIFQNKVKEKLAAESIIANKELAYQNEEKGKRAAELLIANEELIFQNDEKEKRAAELIVANKELAYQNDEKEKRDAELIIANEELLFQNNEKEKRAGELLVANKELAYQNDEKENRASELVIANKELAYQNNEKEKRASELVIANKELAYQNEEKENRAAELIVANKELAFQNDEKEKRALELAVANKELSFQNEVKEKLAANLIIANKELAFQNDEKEKRAAELIVANKELSFQNEVKQKLAANLIVANKELAFQNDEKEKRASELVIANEELVYQNDEKEKRASELMTANVELAFQNDEKEKKEKERTKMVADIVQRNKDLEQFSYIISHNLRSPVANISGVSEVLQIPGLDKDSEKKLLTQLGVSVKRLDEVIMDLNYILQIKHKENRKSELVKFSGLMSNIRVSMEDVIKSSGAKIIGDFSAVDEIRSLKSYLHSIFHNLISNSIKYRQADKTPVIEITSYPDNGKVHILYKDNGMGIDLEKRGGQVFGLYKRFHSHVDGKGMGLFMVKTQVESLGGTIAIVSEVNKGTQFDIEFDIS